MGKRKQKNLNILPAVIEIIADRAEKEGRYEAEIVEQAVIEYAARKEAQETGKMQT